jgi:hypothetical protein
MRKDLDRIPYETIAANPDIKFITDYCCPVKKDKIIYSLQI